MQDPRTGDRRTLPNLAVPCADAFPFEVVDDDLPLVIVAQRRDQFGLDARELGENRQARGRCAPSRFCNRLGTVDGRRGGMGWKLESMGEKESAGCDNPERWLRGQRGWGLGRPQVLCVAAEAGHNAKKRSIVVEAGEKACSRPPFAHWSPSLPSCATLSGRRPTRLCIEVDRANMNAQVT